MPNKQRLVRFDWAMKSILRHKANFDILEGFLMSLLNEEIKIENILESESNKDRHERKNNRVDLKCKDSSGREIIIEIQTQYEYDYLQRILFGTSKAIVESVSVGGKYRSIPKIISVNILYHPMFPNKNDDYIYYGKTDVKGLHTGGTLFVRFDAGLLPEPCDGVMPEYYFLCVGNFSGERVKGKVDEWLYFFKNESIKSSFTAPGIKSAGEKLTYLKMSSREQKEYDAYMDALHYERSTLETAVAEGKAEGISEGIAKGKSETARKMLERGFDISTISELTGLEESEISAGGESNAE